MIAICYSEISRHSLRKQGFGVGRSGPLFNATTNYSVVVRVFNHLDDPLLLTWSGPPGIQMQRHLWQDGLPGTHFLRDGTLLTSFRWKIKLEASALPYSTSREHLLSLVMLTWDAGWSPHHGQCPYKYSSSVPDGIDYLTAHVELGTKSFSITLSDETDVSSHVTFPLWENTRKLEAHNAAALDKKPGVCRDCQGIGPVLSELHSLSLLNSNYIYMITLRKITSSYVKSQSHNDSLFSFDMLQKPHELDIDALMCLYD
ncbi:hypothetical protein HID58_061188 [Brassica napus]|uniref:Plastocyanin-like domain-containing protein n=1 Tax=Brassica napus TaxID=3708 RepID=A0ABQ7ZXY8_BRANA|nr:hypothetical protein HID58_061188 [Brassica napus]